jgi:hypothetical protein
MRTVMSAAIILAATGGLAIAGPANSNAGAAKNMAETLSGTPGIGAAAPTVSGNNAIDGDKSDSGWGNAGSRAVAGEQVSRGKN